jgi:hypothetical protein
MNQEEVTQPDPVNERRVRQKKPMFTRFTGEESPVLHLVQYINECCGDNWDPTVLRLHFGRSLGPNPSTWYRQTAVQAAREWQEMLDLLRFASQHR